MIKTKKRKDIFVCIRISQEDEKYLRQASRKMKTKWLTFIRTSAVQEATKILKG